MTPEQQAWAEAQVNTLVSLGIAPIDATRTVQAALALMPPDADPYTWIPSADDMAREPVDSDAVLADARAAWYASDAVPPTYKRLLDATVDA